MSDSTHDAVLEALKRNRGYLSGEELSDTLGVSRQALWKHIHALKEEGYEIAAVPHLGYKLVASPDRLYPSEISYRLGTKYIGKKVSYREEVASTMDEAAGHARAGAPQGTLVVAEAQSQGRGRRGRNWSSIKHKGIYASLILRPTLAPQRASILTLLVAVSIAEVLRQEAGVECRIKWPNDIVVGSRKLGGILTELEAEIDTVHFAVLGFGLNVNTARSALPPGATSLKEETGSAHNRVELLQGILRAVERRYLFLQQEGASALIAECRSLSTTLGRRVRVAFAKGELQGEATDIDEDGSLLVRQDTGLIEKVTAGDVWHLH